MALTDDDKEWMRAEITSAVKKHIDLRSQGSQTQMGKETREVKGHIDLRSQGLKAQIDKQTEDLTEAIEAPRTLTDH